MGATTGVDVVGWIGTNTIATNCGSGPWLLKVFNEMISGISRSVPADDTLFGCGQNTDICGSE